MTASRTFAYRGLTVRVESADPVPLVWLEEFLTPSFAVDPTAVADCTVTLQVDEREYRDTWQGGQVADSEPVGCFAFEGCLVHLPLWNSTSEDRVIFDGDSEVFYFVNRDSTRIRILTGRRHQSRRIPAMRIVREFAMTRAWSHDSAVIHAAAVAVGGHGIAIAGPKGAGKTSLLIHLLLHHPDAAFVSNDRVVVDCTERAPILRGMPTVVTIRNETLNLFPTFGAAVRQAGYDERLALSEATVQLAQAVGPARQSVGLSPPQLCAVLSTETRGYAMAGALLFPRVSERSGGIEVHGLSPEAAADRLRMLLFGGSALPPQSEVFALANHRTRRLDAAQLEQLCLAFTVRVRSFDCLLGRQAYRAEILPEFVDAVLGD